MINYGYSKTRYWLTACTIAGGFIGLLAGMTGIGGGIFLAPLIYLLHLAPARTVAGITSGFILVNSVAGLAGQMMKTGEYSPLDGWMEAWPLFIVVRHWWTDRKSRLGSLSRLPETWIKRLTAVADTIRRTEADLALDGNDLIGLKSDFLFKCEF